MVKFYRMVQLSDTLVPVPSSPECGHWTTLYKKTLYWTLFLAVFVSGSYPKCCVSDIYIRYGSGMVISNPNIGILVVNEKYIMYIFSFLI
jgi:hypothetical protein